MHSPALNTYRPHLAAAFLVCLLWLLLLFSEVFHRIALPLEVKAVIGVFPPLMASIIIMYGTPLFREMRQIRRVVHLLGVALAMLICAGDLLLTLSLVLLALGINWPP
jgi:hypothetical protein